jgi:hypothetical protein
VGCCKNLIVVSEEAVIEFYSCGDGSMPILSMATLKVAIVAAKAI